jgi:aspartyl-tRNA(Asn)/glutamyl-tRNA(Gln) amidotransferase subunit A
VDRRFFTKEQSLAVAQQSLTHRSFLPTGDASAESAVRASLEAIRRHAGLNAFRTVDAEESLARARVVDARIAAGTAGPLAGMVLGTKDNICRQGKQTGCCSKMLEGFAPPYDATVIRRLEAADAVIIGTTNMDEFAMGSSTEHSAYGRTQHPADASRVPGGSSGGSAAAVAAGLVTAALGSDTGGSIRQPASFCGVVGLKPTYGRVSRYGLVAFATSLDQIGPLTRTVHDAALLLGVIAGHDPNDATSSPEPVPDYASALSGDVRGLRIGLPKEYFAGDVDPEVAAAVRERVRRLSDLGALVQEISLAHAPYQVATYCALSMAEAASNLSRFDGARYGRRAPGARTADALVTRSRSEGFGDEVKRRIMLGTYVASAGADETLYAKALKMRRLIAGDLQSAFGRVDCIITPTTPTTAFAVGAKADDPLRMSMSDVFTVAASLAGVPALSVPCGSDRQGLPIGLQVMGPRFGEPIILRVGGSLERM